MAQRGVLLACILGAVGCLQTPRTTELSVLETAPGDRELRCTVDADCVLKPEPACCGDQLEFHEACYHADADPPASRDCSGNSVCAGRLQVVGCRCDDGACASVVED